MTTEGSSPIGTGDRITNLDTIRGLAVLGILIMNVASFGLAPAAYFNLDAGGSESSLDWFVGIFGEVVADQRFMGMFSILFGAGIVLFADRAETKGRHPVWLSLWRNLLLLGIGVLHSLLWEGDILMVYAVCAPILLLLRKRSALTLMISGTLTVLISPLMAWAAQGSVGVAGEGLGEVWVATGYISDEVGLFLIGDFFCRALGMMLIGVALYRTGILAGSRTRRFYVRMASWGLGVGIPLAVLGVVIVAAGDFGAHVALVGLIPNSIGTIPSVLGYIGLISLWDARPATRAHEVVRATGRMALTNYLAQSVLGVLILSVLLEQRDLGRASLGLFVLAVWGLQLWWSPRWLARYQYGPAEWVWRTATYRYVQPIRQSDRSE